MNIALRHPDIFTGFLSMSGAFDISNFLHGYYDQDVYFNMPPHYMANMSDPWYLDRYRQNTYVLATGWDDQCLGQNQHLSHLLGSRGCPAPARDLGQLEQPRLAHLAAHDECLSLMA